MALPVEYFIGLKYLLAKRKQTFISIITAISVAGVAVGVMALIIVLAVMNGFETELKDRILGATAHIHVTNLEGSISDPFALAQRVGTMDGITAASPYIFSQVMISSGTASTGAILRGVDVATIGKVTRLPQEIRKGKIEDLDRKTTNGLHGMILGKELAANLGVSPGDIVEVLVPGGNITPMGAFPGVATFRVAGFSESGMYEYDSSFAYVSLKEAGRIMGLEGRATGIEVKVGDIYQAGRIASRLRVELGYPYWAKDWMQSNRNLFSAKVVMFIILVLIVMVAAFNIISTLIMVVMDKTKDIAVLMTLGATRRMIRKIFALEGLLSGVAGTFAGTVLGVLLCYLLRRYQFIRLPSDVYYISTLPVDLSPAILLLVGSCSIVICFLATLYPSRQASLVDPAEAIRYE